MVMVRIIFVVLLAALQQWVLAQPRAGHGAAPVVASVVQVVGAAQLEGLPVRNGAAVQPGQWLVTGPDGHLYLQTIDHGFIILRPSSRLRIVHYHIDAVQPQHSRFQIELQQGVARHVSGRAVQAARGQFRFNTPVAAIGIIGTDFTVFSTQDLSRVGVSSGAVQVSGFGNGCLPEGSGPCQGPHSLTLLASQPGWVLQVERGNVAPRLLEGSVPVSHREPEPASGAPAAALAAVVPKPGLRQTDTPLASLPMATVDHPPALHWGRWQALATPGASAADLDLSALRQRATLYALGSHFAVLRQADAGWVLPRHAHASFVLLGQQVQVGAAAAAQLAQVESGQLQFDFVHMRFHTQLQVMAGAELSTLMARGNVAPSGQFDAMPLHFDGSNMFVSGVLANPSTGAGLGPSQAAYMFHARTSSGLPIEGVTFWQQAPMSAR